MTAGGSIGMVLDRALTVDLLDVALRIATEHGGAADARRLLTVALRDHVSPQEAQGKSKKCLTRVWVSPPPEAKAMIEWAVEHQAEADDRAALHFGALLATFPFVGTLAGIVGRQLHLDRAVDPAAVKAEARTLLGDRSTIDVGARKVLTTMRYLGLLQGPGGGPLAPARTARMAPEFAGWLMHGLLLTRRAESVGVAEVTRAPELSLLEVGQSVSLYPFLEFHTENGRTIAVVREQ
jgi:hypothetical protein